MKLIFDLIATRLSPNFPTPEVHNWSSASALCQYSLRATSCLDHATERTVLKRGTANLVEVGDGFTLPSSIHIRHINELVLVSKPRVCPYILR